MKWVGVAGAVGGFLLAVAGSCASSSTFSCGSDDQCVLAGQPGICSEAGLCAYPSDACSSGWVYPAGSPGGVSNECAPGPQPSVTGANTGTTSADTTSSEIPESTTSGADSTTLGTPSSAGSGSTTAAVTDGTGTIGASTSEGPSTGSPSECGTDESNEFENPEVLNTDGCDADVSGRLHGEDGDFFFKSFGPSCEINGFSVEAPDSLNVVCIAVPCAVSGAITCDDADLLADDGLQRCCSYTPHSPDFDLRAEGACEAIEEVTIGVLGTSNGVCDPYSVEVSFSD